LSKGIDGLELISEEIEMLMYSLNDFKVPLMWKFAYKSVKPLMSWLNNFKERMDMFNSWATKGSP